MIKRLGGYTMLILMAVVFGQLAEHVKAADQSTFTIRFDEPNDRPNEKIRWPVTVGVPFALGGLRDPSVVGLKIGEQPATVQKQVLSNWPKDDQSVQWLLLDFQTTFGQNTTQAVQVNREPSTAAASRLKVTETSEQINIDTGVIRFAVSKTAFAGVSNLHLANGTKVLKQTQIYWTDQKDTRYDTASYRDPNVRVETQGPMRVTILAEGWYASNDHEKTNVMMRYQTRITAFAGLPYIRMYTTHIWTEDSTVVANDWGVGFDVANASDDAKVGVVTDGKPSSAPARTDETVFHAVQAGYQKARLISGETETPVHSLTGWASIGNGKTGLAVSVLDLPYETPKSFSMSQDRLTAHLWAPQVGPMSMHEDDRMSNPDTPENHKEWLRYNKIVSPMGVAKTHEIWLWPIGATSVSEQAVNDMVQRPAAAIADPVYQCSTDAIEQLRPAGATPSQYQHVEKALDLMFRYIAQPLDRLKDFETWNHGDVHLFSGSGWRTWDNGGYNWPQIPWLMYYRSGGRHYLEHGRRNARHVMDVDIVHHGKEHAQANEKGLGFKHMFSAHHWAWGPYWDNFHTHPQYLLYYYYMTGYERAKDVLQLMAESSRRRLNVPDVKDWKAREITVSRTQYGQINPKIVYYFSTGDKYFLDAAAGWADLALAFRNDQGRFVNLTFWNFFHRGLINVYSHTGRQEVRDALLYLVEPFGRTYTDAQQAPMWGREMTIALPFAYRVTGNDAYLRYPIWQVLEQTRMVQRDGDLIPWEGGIGYCSLKRTLYPQFIDNAMATLAAWHDTGWKHFEPWPGNNVQFRSRVEKVDTYLSKLTLFAKKSENESGEIRLHFRIGNLSKREKFDGKAMIAEVLSPNGQTRTASVSPDQSTISFAADEPAGTYRITIRGEQEIFWVHPTTTLAGLVVDCTDRPLNFACPHGPGRLHTRFKADAEQMNILIHGTRARSTIPLRIDNISGETIHHVQWPGSRKLNVPIPADEQGQPIVLVKGLCNYVPWDTSEQGAQIDGIEPYIATQAHLWFDPR